MNYLLAPDSELIGRKLSKTTDKLGDTGRKLSKTTDKLGDTGRKLSKTADKLGRYWSKTE